MFQHLVIFSTMLVLGCQAANYGSSGSSGARKYGSGSSMGGGGIKMGFGKMSSAGYGSMDGYGGKPVKLAVQSNHQVDYKDVMSSRQVTPVTVEVGANHIPMNFIFRSASSQLNIQSKHEGAQGSHQETESEDEPHVLKHLVKKPIYQEVKEVITPMRKITQEIKPVEEIIETLISRSKEAKKSSGGYGSMSGMGGYSAGMMSGFGGFGKSRSGGMMAGTKY